MRTNIVPTALQKTLFKAIMMGNRADFDAVSAQQDLDADDVRAVGILWSTKRAKSGTGKDDLASLAMLQELGYDFTDGIVLNEEKENFGQPLPFCLIGNDENEKLLMAMIDTKAIAIGFCDGAGETLLFTAMERDRFDLADQLLAAGIDVNASDLAGDTALHASAGRLSFRAVDWLLRNGADPQRENFSMEVPAQRVTEDPPPGRDADSMFNAIEDHVLGAPFQPNPEFAEMLAAEIKADTPPPADDADEDDDPQAAQPSSKGP